MPENGLIALEYGSIKAFNSSAALGALESSLDPYSVVNRPLFSVICAAVLTKWEFVVFGMFAFLAARYAAYTDEELEAKETEDIAMHTNRSFCCQLEPSV